MDEAIFVIYKAVLKQLTESSQWQRNTKKIKKWIMLKPLWQICIRSTYYSQYLPFCIDHKNNDWSKQNLIKIVNLFSCQPKKLGQENYTMLFKESDIIFKHGLYWNMDIDFTRQFPQFF